MAIATVLSITGQAWAVNADGQRREIKPGDRLGEDETLITAPGGGVELRFDNGQQLHLDGNQQITMQNALGVTSTNGNEEEAASEEAAEEEPQATQPPLWESAPPSGDVLQNTGHRAFSILDTGHGFVRLKRIIEPLPELMYHWEYARDDVPEWWQGPGEDDRTRSEQEPERIPGLTIELQGAGPDGIYSVEEIGPDGTVPALITLDDNVEVGDTLVVTDKDGNVLLNRPVTPEDLRDGVPVQVPVEPGDRDVTVEATITTPEGNSGTDTDDKPVDNVPPVSVTQVPDQSDMDSEGVSVDLGPHFSDDQGEPLSWQAIDLPPGLRIDPNTGLITGTIDRSGSQGGPDNNGEYPVTVLVTDPAGNTTEQTFIWSVGNPPPVADPDTGSTDEKEILTVPASEGVLTNDSDPDGDPLTVSAVNGDPVNVGQPITGDNGGLFTLHPDGSYTFDPNGDFNMLLDGQTATTTIEYTVDDGEGGTATTTLTITVNGETDYVNVDVPVEHPATPLPGDINDHVVFESGLVGGSDNTGTDPVTTATTVNSSFTLSALDGLDPNEAISIQHGGAASPTVLIQLQVQALDTNPQTITTQYGTLELNGYQLAPNGTITIDYLYTLTDAPEVDAEHTSDDFTITVKDVNGVSGSDNLSIRIIDDAPVAEDDTNSVTEGADTSTPNTTATGNVIAGSSTGAGQDTVGADGATVTGAQFGTLGADSPHVADGGVNTASSTSTVLNGTYGSLTIDADGGYTYTLDNGRLETQELLEGEEAEEVFTYTLTDGDGDQATATLTITVHGQDDGVTVTVPDPNDPNEYPAIDPANPNDPDHSAWDDTSDHVVFESGLSDGSSPLESNIQVISSFTLSALDGLDPTTAISIQHGGPEFPTVLDKDMVEALGTAAQTITTEYGTLELNGYNQGTDGTITINYTYTLTSEPDNSDGGAHHDTHAFDNFEITVKDRDGDQNTGTVSIKIMDDVPKAGDDTNSIAAGSYDPAEGNVITGDGADILGADGATVTQVQFGLTSVTVPTTGTVNIDGDHGTLTLDAEGGYGYQRHANTPGGVNDVFTYTLTDGDNDSVTATLTIDIGNAKPEITGGLPLEAEGGALTLKEKYLSEGSAPDAAELTRVGTFTINSPDGVKSLSIGGINVIVNDALVDPMPAITTPQGNTLTVTGYDADTGTITYQVTLNGEEVHGAEGSDTDEGLFESLAVILTDQDKQSASGELVIKIVDDRPKIEVDGDELGHLQVDEAGLVSGAEVSATDHDFIENVFDINHGADGEKSTSYRLEATSSTVSGVVDTQTGTDIYLFMDGQDVVGRVGNSETGDIAFRIKIDSGTGAVTLTQYSSLKHPVSGAEDTNGNPNPHDDPISLTDAAIRLIANAVDRDGDSVDSAAVDIGGKFSFLDDGPKVTAPANGTVDEAHLERGSEQNKDPDMVTVSNSLNVNFGADNAGDVQFTDDATDSTVSVLKGLSLKSRDDELDYVVSEDGHTLTAYRGTSRLDSDRIFTVEITDPAGSPGYTFTLHGPLDHVGETNDLPLNFSHIRVTDGDADWVETGFDINVIDDDPATEAQTIIVDEDSTEAGNPENTFNTNADATGDNTTIGDGTDGTIKAQYGTATVNPDGTITYVPMENYSGKDTFTYTTTTDNEIKTFTIEVTVNPISDAPNMDGTGTTGGDVALDDVSTPEDKAVALGLKTPIVTDDTDQNESDPSNTAGDAPERLGLITLELTGEQVNGVKLTAAADGGSPAVDINYNGSITIWLTDVDHPVDLTKPTGAIEMTSTQFEALELLPAEHRSENIDVSVKAISYEVDDSFNIAVVNGTQVLGATSEATLKVWVQAVTDDVELVFDTTKTSGITNVDGVDYTSNTEATVTLKEDTDFTINDILTATFEDLDGSEVRSITITNGSGQVILVDGTELAGGATREINANDGSAGQTGGLDSFPDISIGAIGDFSGDLDGIGITINAQDMDEDGYNSSNAGTKVDGVAEDDQTNNSVTLNLRVTPVAGDVEAGDVETKEDTAVNFLKNVKVTDTGTENGTEVINSVSFEVPAGWEVTAPTNDDGWSVSGTGAVSDPYTITFNDDSGAGTVLDEIAREAVLDGFTIRPPAHSSADVTITLNVTTTDTNGTDSDTQTVALEVEITVTPVAERIKEPGAVDDIDTDGNSIPDLTMNSDHTYTTAGAEDVWFELKTGGFDLKGPWNNEDSSEETFARFTPYTTDDLRKEPGEYALLEGSYFQYNDGTNIIEVPYNGTPVDIPIAYLDTVQFKGPLNFKGIVHIKVEAMTIDYDEDDNTPTDPAVSGEAWLANMILHPVADQVTLKVQSRITADEDAGRTPGTDPIDLNIRPTSDDPDETFNVTIKGIPAGASITYDGVEYDTTATDLPDGLTLEDDDSFTLVLKDFDDTKPPKLIPPQDSNETIRLQVEAVSIDELAYIDADGKSVTLTSPASDPHILPVTITLNGVPDEPVITITTPEKPYTENDLDNEGNTVELRDLVTELKSGEEADDGSETVTLRISGLDDRFSIEGAGPVIGTASGTGRVWVVTPEQIADGSVKIKLPPNYSGTVAFTAQPVVTEDDNPSETFFATESVEFTVTPSPEALLNTNSAMTEDLVGQIDFSADHQNGDTDEFISAVRFKLHPDTADKDVKFYSDADGIQLLAPDEEGWYEVTGAEGVESLYAKGPANFHGEIKLDVEYKVTDPSEDGTLGPVTSDDWEKSEHTLDVKAVTDPVDLTLASINGDTEATSISLDGAGDVIVSLNIAKQPDSKAGDSSDHDGSEQLTHILIQGVPEGVAVEGAVLTGAGQWLLSATDVFNDGGISKDIVFQVNGMAGSINNAEITITAVTLDDGADKPEQDSISWTLNTDFTGEGEDTLPTVTLEAIDSGQTEDEGFKLSEVVSGAVTGSSNQGSYDMTITLRTDPDDETTFDGMTRTEAVEDGQPVVLWTRTVTGVTDATAQQAMEDALAAITVNPPEHANANNLAGDGKLPLDVTVAFHANGMHSEDNVKPQVELAPLTDKATVAISAEPVDEGADMAVTIAVSNPADNNDWTIEGDKLYLRLEDGGIAGTLLDSEGEPINFTSVSGIDGLVNGDYFVIYGVQPDTELNLIFRPTNPYEKGDVTLTGWVQNQETGSDVVELSSGEQQLVVNPTNTEPDNMEITATGVEHNGEDRTRAELEITGNILPDDSETLHSAFIEGLPKDFTVFYGTDADSAVMAGNAGGSGDTNTWSIPVSGGELPKYLAIQPPAHWSGTLADLTLYLVSGEEGLEPTPWPVEFDVTIEPQADGIDLNPTPSFGTAGDIISLNLNASMKDPVQANDSDQHQELTTLELTGFPDGEKVVFYANGSELADERVSFESGKHTITGLTQAELDGLGFLHLGTGGVKDIGITAWTQEVDVDGNVVGEASPPSATEMVTINVADKLPTNERDTLLWDDSFASLDSPIDLRDGEDIILFRDNDVMTGADLANSFSNLEIIDMVGRGSSTINSLRAEDVLDMTEGNESAGDNLLIIRIDGDDEVNLAASSDWVDQGEGVYHAIVRDETVRVKIEENLIE